MFDIPNGGLTNTKTNNTILVADFLPGYLTACGNVNSAPSDTPGFTCALDRNVVLNSNIILKWNTSGLMSNTLTYDSTCSCYRKKADFLTVLLHELGHIWTLAHPTPTTPGMYAGWTTKSVLTEDDKRGATQFYGPHTGWEKALTLPWFPGHTYTETLGNENVVLSQHQVSSPQLTPRPAELSVTPYSGSRHLKI